MILYHVPFLKVQICVQNLNLHYVNVTLPELLAHFRIFFFTFFNKFNFCFSFCLSMQNQTAIYVGFLMFEFCVGKILTLECFSWARLLLCNVWGVIPLGHLPGFNI